LCAEASFNPWKVAVEAVFFSWDITIPADTSEKDPLEKDLTLTHGVITRIDVKFPPGCHGLVKVRLFRFDSQLIPLTRDEWVTGDGETVPTALPLHYELLEEPYALKFVGCSPGAQYKHTVTVRVNVMRPRPDPVEQLVELLRTLFERMGLIR